MSSGRSIDFSSTLLLYWPSSFCVVQSYAQGLYAALVGLGCSVDRVSINLEDDLARAATRSKEYTAVIAMGGVALERRIDGMGISMYFSDIPILYYSLDAPTYDFARVRDARSYLEHSRHESRLKFVCPERGYAGLLSEVVGHPTIWCPFPGFFAPLMDPETPAREARLAVFGTLDRGMNGTDHASLMDLLNDLAPPGTAAKLHEALTNPEESPNVTTVIKRVLKLSAPETFRLANLSLITPVDSWLKRSRRYKLIDQLRGLPIDFYGKGWIEIFGDCESFRFFADIPFYMVNRFMQKYKGVINFDPNWADGVHDRVFTALGSGCRVLTNHNRCIDELDLPVGAVERYNAEAPNARNQALDLLDSSPLSLETRMSVRANHGWPNRLDRISRAVIEGA